MHISEIRSAKDFVKWSSQCVTNITVADLLEALSYLALLLVLYAGLYLCIGDPFLPGKQGSAWAILIIWVGGHIGAFLAELINIPAPVGMICAGLFLKNVGNAVLISGLKPSWSKEIRGAALAIIFLRSGLELDLAIFKEIGIPAVKLLLIPGIVEAFFDGGIAVALFGMPPLLGFALGFILKAIGPALVIQLMFELQQKRLGIARKLPTTVVAAASFDDMVAITGYTIFINIAVQGQSNKAWHIAQGPLSVVFGFMLGCVAALACSATRLWNNKYKRVAMLVFSALSMKYFFDQYQFESGGALAALSLGLIVKELWKRQWPYFLAEQNDEPHENIREAEKAVRFLWRFLLMPLLFCLIGATITFATLPGTTIAKACAIIFSGLGLRMVVTFLVMLTSRYSVLESIFFAIAWTPKATVQAALGGLPLEAIQRAYPVGSPQRAEYLAYGQDMLTTAVFEILISGTLGSLLVRWLSPLLLTRDEPPADVLRHPSERRIDKKLPSVGGGLDSLDGAPSMTSAALDAAADQDLVGEHVGHLEQLATALITTGGRDEEEDARVYGERLKAGVRALKMRLNEEINARDVIGADAYRQALMEISRRNRMAASASSRTLGDLEANSVGPVMGASFSRRRTGGDSGRSQIEIVEHAARSA